MNKAPLLFSHLVRRPDAQIDLGAAALAIAAGEYPDLDIGHYLARLDELAAGLPATADAVVTRLFHELGLRGNETDYYDARNSFLSDVLDRRLGIPITLSVVFLEVSRRVGLGAAGVGFPGHFLVRVGGQVTLYSAFGVVMTTTDGRANSKSTRSKVARRAASRCSIPSTAASAAPSTGRTLRWETGTSSIACW